MKSVTTLPIVHCKINFFSRPTFLQFSLSLSLFSPQLPRTSGCSLRQEVTVTNKSPVAFSTNHELSFIYFFFSINDVLRNGSVFQEKREPEGEVVGSWKGRKSCKTLVADCPVIRVN